MSKKEHVVQVQPPHFVIASGRIEVHQLRAWQDNFIWVMYDRERKEAVVVDGPEADIFLDWLGEHPCEQIQIWNTHHHHDHVGINKALCSDPSLNVEVYGSKHQREAIPGIKYTLVDGDTLEFSGEQFVVWRTDGHVDGHLCFVHDDILFCGDTLFAGGCGYLFDGPPAAMFDSLTRLSELSADVKVCCAHEYTLDNLRFAHFIEPKNEQVKARLTDVQRLRAQGRTTLPSTIGVERQTNPFLRSESNTLRTAVSEYHSTSITNELELFTVIRKLKDQKIHRG